MRTASTEVEEPRFGKKMYRHLPSLRERVIRSRATPVQPWSSGSIPLRAGPRKLWSDDTMQKAVAAVEKQGESIRRVSEKYGIPRSTLHDHISGKVEHGSKPGQASYLSPEEEEELVSFLVKCARIGYPHTRKQVMSLVQEIVNAKGIITTISDGWWERFKQRHPMITLRVAAPLSYARAMASDRDSLNNYFDLLEDTLKSNEIFNDASRIFNCDETGIPLNPPSSKVVDKVGAKNPSYLTGSTKTQVTVLACTCATGYVIPPFVIFDRKTLNPELTKGEVPGTLYGLSSNGWIDMELFSGWLFDHFLKYAPRCRPLLLLLDGHSSHYCPEAIKMAAAEKVIIFALPPNTTHLAQPLDRSCFSPLKSQWKQVVQAFVARYHRSVTRYDFCSLFSNAWMTAMSMKNVIAGFRVCGVYPFDREALVLPEEKYTSFKPETLPQRSGLKYIPMYSPMRPRPEPLCSSPFPDCSSRRVSTPAEDSSAGIEFFDDSLQLLECSSHSESFLYDLPAFDQTASVAHTPDQSKCSLALGRATALSQFLVTPTPPSKLPTKRPKSCGRVLTSRENLQDLEEKEQKKKAALKEKEERRKVREEKKLLRESKSAAKTGIRRPSTSAMTSKTKAPLKRSVNHEKADKSAATTGIRRPSTSAMTPKAKAPLKRSVNLEKADKSAATTGIKRPSTSAMTPKTKAPLKGSHGGKTAPLQVRTRSQRGRMSGSTCISSDAQVITEEGATTANISTRTRSQRRHVRFEEQQESSTPGKMASKREECTVTKVDQPEHPPSKIEARQQRLERMKVVRRGSYRVPSLEEIRSGEWLNDSHIEAVSILLKAHFPDKSGLYDPKLGQDLAFPVTKPPLVQIVHVADHWLTVEGVSPSVARVYDSMNYTTSMDTQSQIAAVMQCMAASITLEVQNVQLQIGSSDCGLYAIAYATDLCYGNNPSNLRYNQSKMRSHLIKCLEGQKMTPFPSRFRRPSHPKIEEVRVYCKCRLPDNGEEDMAACDNCNEWYHLTCGNIPAEVFSSETLWLCHMCGES